MIELDPRAAAAGVRIVAHEEIDSTNAQALRLVREGERGPLWIVATRQSAGRGRRGRTWVSPPGNLYASLLLTDPAPPDCWPQMSFVAALAAHDAIAARVPHLAPRLLLKWPNDLLVGPAKAAGILIEGEPAPSRVVVVGIGVNCASHPAGLDYPATDLAAEGADVAADALMGALSATMLERLSQWDRGRGFAAIRADWVAHAAWLGESIRVRTAGREIAGRFADIDEGGGLAVDGPAGREIVRAGDVVGPSLTLPRLRGSDGGELASAGGGPG
jgi:BirA family transcriptional regulator, biotin operon repressor / biotin---[acetyl-CoA-carboxylase] ligase